MKLAVIYFPETTNLNHGNFYRRCHSRSILARIGRCYLRLSTRIRTGIKSMGVDASRHREGPNWGPPLNPSNHSPVMHERFLEVSNWVPMMPRDVRLSDSCTSDRCFFFPFFHGVYFPTRCFSNVANAGTSCDTHTNVCHQAHFTARISFGI